MINYKTVSVEVSKCLCKNCGKQFDTYRLPDFVYGERLILTEDGIDYAYINCFDDKVFDEVGKIVDNFYRGKNVSQYQTANYFNKVFGYACDYVNGKRLDASNITHACPECRSKQLKVIESQIPVTTIVNFSIITYVLWNKNSNAEKESIILNELKQRGCI